MASDKKPKLSGDHHKFIQTLQKHGLITTPVQRFDTGGTVHATATDTPVAPTTTGPGGGTGQAPAAVPTSNPNNISGGINDIAHPTGGYNPLGDAYGAVGKPLQTGVTGAGNFMQGLVSAFTPQNTFQAQVAPTDYTNYQGYINQAGNNALGGYGTTQNLLSQQQALANQLAAQSQGAGPNPAQNMLNQNTGQNIKNQAALMAGQRGAGANAGLIARQAAQQGSQAQQNAIGQAATLQAQQNLAQQAQLQQQQAQMAQTNLQQQGYSNQLFGTAAGAQNAQNANQIANYNMAQGLNQATAGQNAAANQSTMGGLLGGVGSLIGGLFAEGGEVDSANPATSFAPISTGPQSILGQMLSAPKPSTSTDDKGEGKGASGLMSGAGSFFAQGGNVGARLKAGGHVPGKPQVAGNSYKNDTVKALLSPGEVVIPNSIMQSKDPTSGAARFVAAILAKKRGGK